MIKVEMQNMDNDHASRSLKGFLVRYADMISLAISGSKDYLVTVVETWQ